MDAFEEVYERHSAAVRRFALFLTGDPSLADDLVAEVFVRAWQARDRIQLPTVRARSDAHTNPGIVVGIILSWVAAATWFSGSRGAIPVFGRLRGRRGHL
jgi:hypothetical protein